MNKIEIDKDEILKSSKWVRFIFMVLYAFAINFALTIFIGLAFIQFLFVLFTSKPNSSISSFNDNIIEFFNDSLGFLLFNTEQKPFPFKNNISDDEVIEAEVDEVEQAESDEKSDETSEESKS
jgi:hypothetical protein